MQKKKRKYRGLRRVGRVFLALMIFLVVVLLFIRSPWGQNIIVSKVTDYISDKTNTEVNIDRLFITFSGGVSLEGLYLADTKGDTLVYSKALEAHIPLSPILFGNELALKSLDWNGLTAYIKRKEGSEKFNFNFLLEAFMSQDTTATVQKGQPMAIDLGSIHLSDFKIEYDDAFLGIDSELDLGRLVLDARKTDLQHMRFELEDLALYNTTLSYSQTKPFTTEQDTTQTVLPHLTVDNFKIENVKTNYRSIPDGVIANLSIGDFLLELPAADLTSSNFEIDLLRLNNADIDIRTSEKKQQVQDSALSKDTQRLFEWPKFHIDANAVSLNDNNFSYRVGNDPTEGKGIYPDDIAITNLTLEGQNLTYEPKKSSLELSTLSFREKSGFQLKNIAFKANLDATAASISNLELETNNSVLVADLRLKYTTVDELVQTPEKTHIALRIPNMTIGLSDVFLFNPELVNNTYLQKAAQKPFNGQLTARGTLDSLQIPDLSIDWGESTSLVAQGSLSHVMRPDSLLFSLDTIRVASQRKDILTFVSEKEMGISIPKSILLEANTTGSPTNFNAETLLKTTEGYATLKGHYEKDGNQINFDGDLKVDSLQLGQLLKNDQLGQISFTMKASGNGNNLSTLNARVSSDFSQLTYNDYDFSDLALKGEIENGRGNINLRFKNKNLNVDANTIVNLDSLNSGLELSANVIGADLYALGLTKENIKAGVKINADFFGNSEEFELDALVSEGVAVMADEQYQMDDLTLAMKTRKDSTDVLIKSGFLNGFLQSNASPTALSLAIEKQFKNYFSTNDPTTSKATNEPVQLKMDISLKPAPILTNVFFRGVEQLDSLAISGNFDTATKELNASLHIPSATYNQSAIDSLSILVKGDSTDLNFSAGFASLLSEPLHIKKTYLEGELKKRQLFLDFNSYDDDEKLIHIASEMTLAKDTINFHINPSELIFNRKEWTIQQENNIKIAEKFLSLENMTLNRDTQKLTLSNSIPGIEKEHVGITFDNFKLQTFFSLLNPDEALASGVVKGNFVVENPFDATGIIADFIINDLALLQNPMGNLSLNATSQGLSQYDFDLAVKEGALDLDLTGDYVAAETGAKLNLDLDLNRLDMTLAQGFSQGTIKDADGFISGNISVSGTTATPTYEGKVTFNQTNFKVSALNAMLSISDETFRIDNSGLYLDGFSINDKNNNTFHIDGSILTEDLINPEFDLAVTAEKFQLLNATKEDNELFYGEVSVDADIKINGNLNLPKIDGKLKVRKVTEMTYVVPEAQLDVEERDGVVIFVNRKNPDAILTRNDQEETQAFFKGFDATVILEIADDAVFHVIIDENTGDNLQVSGNAALNLNVAPNGRINLTGRYELNSGHYETSLYNLVKRKFEINPGSTITWLGDPMDAKLDVTAVYKVETSAAPLMATVTSGQDISITGKYRQVLPFLVYLNVEGELLRPELSFDLDMPEDEQGSLGGAVYGRVQQLNEQEAELNKQVFSLLALNRFFPGSGSDGSSGGTAALAKDNVNKVLSGQLNAFSDKIFGKAGFELDFDLDSFTDYQGENPQDRTQLNINARKKLFNDRLVVTAGSAVDVEGSAQPGQEETPIIGNVSLEYLLTRDGRYRLKGFRKNEFQNVIDGQLIVTGIALILNREFNAFSQLFSPLKDTAPKSKDTEPNNKTETPETEDSQTDDTNN